MQGMNGHVHGFCRVLIAVTFGSVALSGCWSGGGGRSVEIQSIEQGSRLNASITLQAYRSSDANSAEIYMTDLPESALDAGADLSGVAGNMTQLRMFIDPEPGSTPIDQTACSVTIRHIVIAGGEVGVYAGGGFLNPPDTPGERTFSGTVRRATVRLVAASPGFKDLLGPSEFTGAFTAKNDEKLARRMEARFRSLLPGAP
ncbi:MAG: hypothetical protein IT436_07810 [Phycisphaerales bacterium]|nr:hypothetical protein [Phycisphaerales bacterium]